MYHQRQSITIYFSPRLPSIATGVGESIPKIEIKNFHLIPISKQRKHLVAKETKTPKVTPDTPLNQPRVATSL